MWQGNSSPGGLDAVMYHETVAFQIFVNNSRHLCVYVCVFVHVCARVWSVQYICPVGLLSLLV